MRILDIIERDELLELSRPFDALAWTHIVFRVAGEALLFTGAVLLLDRSFALALLFFYACAVWHGFWGYAGLGHELYHARVFASRRVNEAWFRIASYLTWNNPQFFRNSHNHHHRFTFTDDDGEGFSRQDWRLPAVAFYLTVDLPLVARRSFYAVINGAGYTRRGGAFAPIGGAYRTEAAGMLAFNVLGHVLLWLLVQRWEANLMWFLLPFTGQFLNRLLAQSQHIDLAGFKDKGPLRHSRTMRLPALLEFLYAGMNFHAEHHLAPAIPYYRLPRLHARLVRENLLSCPDALAFLTRDIWRVLHK